MHPFIVLVYRDMRKDYEKLFTNLDPKKPPRGLFDRIILAIKQEQELRHTKRLLFGFLSLLLISLVVTPISGVMLVSQIENSGISYFISTAISDLGTFFVLWQDFSLAIVESLPIGGIMAFLLSLAVSVFTLRLFLHKKRLLLGYLKQNFA
jgi:hypothetical protein